MTNINTVYESKYISAPDLQSKAIELIISQVNPEQTTDGKTKLCVYFQGKKKGLLLNVTNARNIANLYGPETDNWVGRPITLFTAWVDFQGKTTEAVRVRAAATHAAPAPAQHPNAPVNHMNNSVPYDDEIPF